MRELIQTWPASLTRAQIDAKNVSALLQSERDATLFALPDKMDEIHVSTIRWLSDQCARRSNSLVIMIKDSGAFNQYFAVFKL
ncbi:hypothetical protein N9E91_04060 [Alphaproteobacteria bacterium]|nr:hypothetical protein [Alphaproteobacteria bacterium]